MNRNALKHARDRDLANSFAALRRAAQSTRQQAVRTGTGIVVVRDGQLTRVTADELRSQESQPPI